MKCSREGSVALFTLLLACAAGSASAQCLPSPTPPEFARPCDQHYPRWTGELASLGVNALLGGLSGGVVQELRGGSFRDGFTRGTAGGGIIYIAKRAAASRFDGAGLLGRELGSVGASVVRNAGLGQPSFSELVFPVGVARLYVRPSNRTVRIVPDLTAVAWTISGIQNRAFRFDLKHSLSDGTPVFFADNKIISVGNDSTHAGGVTNSSVLFLANVPAFGPDVARLDEEHERVHMVQEDQLFLTVTDPFEDWAVSKVPHAGPFFVRHVDINLATTLIDFLSGEMPKFLDRPWETEAVFRAR